jgi:formate C-acetyltransferase
MQLYSDSWEGFTRGMWSQGIDVRDFIQTNYTEYTGDEAFLAQPSSGTLALWARVCELMKDEREKGGVLDMDTSVVSAVTSHEAGYIGTDIKDMEKIVGLQTDKPLKRALQPFGGIRVAEQALATHGYEIDPHVKEIFTKYAKTHNQGVFDVYTPEMRLARKSGIITGLPDSYGRGRIIGDYRRVALYGTDLLLEDKKHQLKTTLVRMTGDTIRLREELTEQIRALEDLHRLGEIYGLDISSPAKNAREAVQWTYFGYLAAVKEQNGAAESIGRVSTFLDIFIEKDIQRGIITEQEAQELVDHFVMKLRMVRFARTPDYESLFSGDPVWVTESIGGMGTDGRSLVSKNSYRFLHTLTNLGTAPEPNLTVLWSERLPDSFKRYAAGMSIATSAIQYENDDIMRPIHGDDYAIACCVSSMAVGKEMQFFGARANLAKCLLYAINGGVDEQLGIQIGPKYHAVEGDYLDYDDVIDKFNAMSEWLAGLYVNTLNIIHYMHDKYSYEKMQMALHDREVTRFFATGISGFSVIADSLSAIKYAKVRCIRDERGIVTDYEVQGDFPKFGNDDDRVDEIAVGVAKHFIEKIQQHHTYRNSIPTMSILTITSNVVYGQKTGATPDGRRSGEPFAPGANPMHGRDANGATASLASVAKIPFRYAMDGISNTFSIVPWALGKDDIYYLENGKTDVSSREANLETIISAYMAQGGHHLNVNVFSREMLLDAQAHPEKYPQLTVRVSGYAVHFHKLTKQQQDEVIARTFHEKP